jgi:hypothetical protein
MKNIEKKFTALIFIVFICILRFGWIIQKKLDSLLLNIIGNVGWQEFVANITSYVIGAGLAFYIFYVLYEICIEWERRGKIAEKYDSESRL